jgi:hypothetical protein
MPLSPSSLGKSQRNERTQYQKRREDGEKKQEKETFWVNYKIQPSPHVHRTELAVSVGCKEKGWMEKRGERRKSRWTSYTCPISFSFIHEHV